MKLISQILHKFKSQLGDDYEAYHNHAQRVYQYAIILLLMRESKKLALTAAFHDLDVWITNTMDYLPGSVQLALDYLKDSDFHFLPDEVKYIISHHHKIRPIKGNIEAEAFRKADLIDLTGGQIRYNLPQSIISETERRYPRHGFTRMILKKSMYHALIHPINPFPVLRW